ncbi:spermatogenesis-associated protein 31A3-like [Manis pentadactyla]|uniref:spermatogenesis-associated protein 31A3-like n=1 Tax=Manis pentadactyla TaxID=143292 RepID=UPI00255CA0DA|nr:spermatogenesis-associated protein 31A3-like [Manis pentadactyla]
MASFVPPRNSTPTPTPCDSMALCLGTLPQSLTPYAPWLASPTQIISGIGCATSPIPAPSRCQADAKAWSLSTSSRSKSQQDHLPQHPPEVSFWGHPTDKQGQTSEGQTPGGVHPFRFAVSQALDPSAESLTHREARNPAPSKGQEPDTSTSQGFAIFSPPTQQNLETDITRLQARHRWHPPLKILKVINLFESKKAQPSPLLCSPCTCSATCVPGAQLNKQLGFSDISVRLPEHVQWGHSQGQHNSRSVPDSGASGAQGITTAVGRILEERITLQHGHPPSELNWHKGQFQAPAGEHGATDFLYHRLLSFEEQGRVMREEACSLQATLKGHSSPGKSRWARDKDGNRAFLPHELGCPDRPGQQGPRVAGASACTHHRPRLCVIQNYVSPVQQEQQKEDALRL